MRSKLVYDDIVVGAGSAGAVMAARLSENPERQVLLIEAGRDYPALKEMPSVLLDPSNPVLEGHNWHIPAHSRTGGLMKSLISAGATFMNAGAQSRQGMASTMLAARSLTPQTLGTFDYAIGKVVGGSSSTNSAVAMRGSPSDYDDWARETGDSGWSWEQVLPRFVAMESDRDCEAPHHGRGGPIPITREKGPDLAPLQKAFVDTCVRLGFARCADQNAPDASGVGILPKYVLDQRRMSAALTHLAAARERPNLHLLTEASVDRILWKDGHTCAGVEVIVAGARQKIDGRRLILCAGALNTPSILLRSGVGQPQQLAKLGIETRIVLPGVGENLADHPVVGIWGVPCEGVSCFGEPIHQTVLRHTSAGSDSPNDVQLSMLGGFQTSSIPLLAQALGSPLGAAVVAGVSRPKSRGRLRLASSDPAAMPHVVTNCLQDADDMRRMKAGVRIAWDILQHERMMPLLQKIFAWNSGLFASDNLFEKALTTFVRPSWHAAGTAKMGRAGDPLAVVNSHGRVFGVDNLWIADASIMPSLPNAPTHLSCVMIADRISDLLNDAK